jgi:hypothetical protein
MSLISYLSLEYLYIAVIGALEFTLSPALLYFIAQKKINNTNKFVENVLK